MARTRTLIRLTRQKNEERGGRETAKKGRERLEEGERETGKRRGGRERDWEDERRGRERLGRREEGRERDLLICI